MSKWWVVAVVALMPMLSDAQTVSDSASYRRAQTLVNDGNSVAGRAIVDSLIARATPGTNEYAEGLYWRAILSATASDAEMDYRRIIVDYPLSPRAADVYLRLAQLELARADYDGALQHLTRLTLEYPASPARARASYWTARVLFEKNDIPRACAANADALSRTSEQETELRNQIAYLNQRCAGVVIASAGADTIRKDLSVPAARPDSAHVLTPQPEITQPVKTAVTPAKPPMQVPTAPRDAKPTMIEPPPKESYPKTASPAASGEGQYTVQVAAYNVKSQAAAMVAKLKKRGYEARVSGSSAPFRVRIGRYATEAQATAVMRSLKAKQISGFVVKAEPR
ncbi:MAG: SPOR domain-containing protein [Gemmatimonadales bacterium]